MRRPRAVDARSAAAPWAIPRPHRLVPTCHTTSGACGLDQVTARFTLSSKSVIQILRVPHSLEVLNLGISMLCGPHHRWRRTESGELRREVPPFCRTVATGETCDWVRSRSLEGLLVSDDPSGKYNAVRWLTIGASPDDPHLHIDCGTAGPEVEIALRAGVSVHDVRAAADLRQLLDELGIR